MQVLGGICCNICDSFIVNSNNSLEVLDKLKTLFKDEKLRKSLSDNAIAFSKKFDVNKKSSFIYDIVKEDNQ